MATKTKLKTTTVKFGDGYFDQVFGNTDELIANADFQLKAMDVQFDSMVGVGLSGILALPLLARHFNVPFLALRKPEEDCHDTYGIGRIGRGAIGKRWILVDDFVSSGRTISRAQEYVSQGLSVLNSGRTTSFKSTYVGTYCYGGESSTTMGGHFVTPDGIKISRALIEIDGEEITVDGNAYRRLKYYLSSYMRMEKRDPKGLAISVIRDGDWCNDPFPDVDELSAMAVYAERVIREEES